MEGFLWPGMGSHTESLYRLGLVKSHSQGQPTFKGSRYTGVNTTHVAH